MGLDSYITRRVSNPIHHMTEGLKPLINRGREVQIPHTTFYKGCNPTYRVLKRLQSHVPRIKKRLQSHIVYIKKFQFHIPRIKIRSRYHVLKKVRILHTLQQNGSNPTYHVVKTLQSHILSQKRFRSHIPHIKKDL